MRLPLAHAYWRRAPSARSPLPTAATACSSTHSRTTFCSARICVHELIDAAAPARGRLVAAALRADGARHRLIGEPRRQILDGALHLQMALESWRLT